MSEYHPGTSGVPARARAGRQGRRWRRPPGKHRRARRIAMTGGTAVMAIGIAVPVLTGGTGHNSPARLPSSILCGSWSRCDARGYNSYGYGAHEYKAYWRMSPGDECTNYAAFVESTVYHVPAPSFLLGNGGDWAATARAHGVLVNHTPSVGAVAEWNGGSFGMGPAGHVAVVEEVARGGRGIVVSQQHMGGVADYNWTRIKARASANQWQEWPSYFIHFPIPRRADVGYFNRRTDTYRLRYSQTAGPVNRAGRLGIRGSVPLLGDWTGRGANQFGYYNPVHGTFHLLGAGTARRPNLTITAGAPHMIPLVGDWNATGRDSVGFYDPRTAMFSLRASLANGALKTFRLGRPGMIPLAGDWNGGGHDSVGYYNPRKGIFNLRIKLSTGQPWASFRFGPPHMIPVVGNWTGHGRKDGIGYYNPRTGAFHLRDRLSAGPADSIVRFGRPRMTPLAGEWFGI